MSALGHKLPRRLTVLVSALSPKAAAAVAVGAAAKGQNRPPALQHDRHAYTDARLSFNHDAHPSTAVLKNSVINWRGRTTIASVACIFFHISRRYLSCC
jgi:hypothetical protein